jgi:hypothetical protein
MYCNHGLGSGGDADLASLLSAVDTALVVRLARPEQMEHNFPLVGEVG